jgi:hypothetical protein
VLASFGIQPGASVASKLGTPDQENVSLTNDFLGSLSILSLFPLAGVTMWPASTRFRFTLGSPSALSGACLFVADTDELEAGGPK